MTALGPPGPTCGVVLDWLCDDEANGNSPIPIDELTSWLSIVPGILTFRRAQQRFHCRYGFYPKRHHCPWPAGVTFTISRWRREPASAWRCAEARPPPRHALPQTWDPPRKLYRLPDEVPLGSMMDWLYGRPPWENREPWAVWVDDDGYRYLKIDGKLTREEDREFD